MGKRFFAGLIAAGLVLVACVGGEDSGDATTSSLTATTTTTKAGSSTTTKTTTLVAVTPVVDEAFLAEQAANVSGGSGGAFMVAVIDADGEVVYTGSGTDPDGNPLTPDAALRVGSITKVFTSLVTLSLVDEGLVDLDALALDYVTRVPVPDGVAVRDLLQHTSGIPEHVDRPGFLDMLHDDQRRVWSPEEAVDLIAGIEPLFAPGAEWSYSNTNYLILGVLIEEVTGRPFHEVLRARILDPLGLDSTYLPGFEDGTAPFGAYTSEFGPAEPLDFDYTSIATIAWAAGSVVSSAEDLHLLFTAMFDGTLISADSLAEIVGTPSALTQAAFPFEYGLGIEVWDDPEGLFGHGGGIPGYITLVLHDSDTGTTAFWVVTADYMDFRSAVRGVAERIAGTP
jgi:D-alanyl-D-alanine carboxypeptidase